MLPGLLSLILIILSYQVVFLDKFVPGTQIGDTNISFKTKKQAQDLLSSKFTNRANQTLEFSYHDTSYKINLANTSIDTTATTNEAFKSGRIGPISAPFWKKTFTPKIEFNLDQQIGPIEQEVMKPAKNAAISESLVITEGEDGSELDRDMLFKNLRDYIGFGKNPTTLPIKSSSPEITNAKVNLAKAYLEKANQEPVKLTFEDKNWTLDGKTLLRLFNLKDGSELLDKEKLNTYLGNVEKVVNQPLHEALFSFNPDNGRVSSFQPAQEGRELDNEKTAILIDLALKQERPKTITLPIKVIAPSIATESVNNLGIKELIGRGVSNFAGSIPNRAYNVSLTANKINGVLVPPGQIFSFNGTVGDISAATGFKQAYVISEGRTILGDGGGVCQDSTTLFRAVLNAGLPVVKRTAHAYRVGYYEQGFPPGLDATVYYPSVDFQFKNDTDHHILIQAHTEGVTLFVDLYGTSDNRTVSMSTPIISNFTPAPPEIRQDDPTLPKGTVKQVDFAAAGATVNFNRTVTKNGQVLIQENWRSNYKPWQAIYLVGVGG